MNVRPPTDIVFPELAPALRARRPRRRPRTQFGRDVRWFFSLPSMALMAVGGLLGIALVVLSTPDAHADDPDDTTFLTALAAEGFRYVDTAKVLSNGRHVCELLAAGASRYDIVTALTTAEPAADRAASSLFGAVANAVYCPQLGAGVTKA